MKPALNRFQNPVCGSLLSMISRPSSSMRQRTLPSSLRKTS